MIFGICYIKFDFFYYFNNLMENWNNLMEMENLFNDLPKILQNTYMNLNPLNPENSEENYQELLRENLTSYGRIDSEITSQRYVNNINNEKIFLKNKT